MLCWTMQIGLGSVNHTSSANEPWVSVLCSVIRSWWSDHGRTGFLFANTANFVRWHLELALFEEVLPNCFVLNFGYCGVVVWCCPCGCEFNVPCIRGCVLRGRRKQLVHFLCRKATKLWQVFKGMSWYVYVFGFLAMLRAINIHRRRLACLRLRGSVKLDLFSAARKVCMNPKSMKLCFFFRISRRVFCHFLECGIA